jgi:hypothetical protein
VRIQARTRSATGVLSPRRAISSDDGLYTFRASGPQVAIDADGNAVFLWDRYDGSSFWIEARSRSLAGVLGPVQTLAHSHASAPDPQLTLDPTGNAVFVWASADTYTTIETRQLSAAGVLGPIATLWPGQYRVDPQNYHVAVNAAGDALFVWAVGNGNHGFPIARSRTAAGAVGPMEFITVLDSSQIPKQGSWPQVSFAPEGDALFVWTTSERISPTTVVSVMHARTRSAEGVLGDPQDVQTFAAGEAGAAELTVSANGQALAVWSFYDGTNYRIAASVDPN